MTIGQCRRLGHQCSCMLSTRRKSKNVSVSDTCEMTSKLLWTQVPYDRDLETGSPNSVVVPSMSALFVIVFSVQIFTYKYSEGVDSNHDGTWECVLDLGPGLFLFLPCAVWKTMAPMPFLSVVWKHGYDWGHPDLVFILAARASSSTC